MTRLVRTPGPHVVVTDLDAWAIDDDDYRHLAKSLRMRDGDPLSVTDGQGRWCTAVFAATIEPAGEITSDPAPSPVLSIGFALVKSAKPELIVQKLTELGIDRILPFRAERSVVQWDPDRAAKARARLQRVAREALMQSKGAWLPHIGEVTSLGDLVADTPDAPVVVRADFDEQARSVQEVFDASEPSVLGLVGPEGGWSESERATVPDSVRLSDRVLRAETACIALGTLLGAERLRRSAHLHQ